MRITTWGEYGVIVGLHLARHSGRDPLPARDIAEAEQLPPDYIEQILLKLRRAGLVESVRGAKGGYRLARDAHEITVKDVLEAAEDRVFFEVNCDMHQVDEDRCRPTSACSIRPVWRELQRRMADYLASVSLADLLASEPRVHDLVTLEHRS